MSVRYIPESVKLRLWGKSGGRCHYCNTPLYRDELTRAKFNTAYIAHIIADKPGGPRGDPVLSEQLKRDISNLMLLCDAHHRLVDRADIKGHPVEHLRSMKAAHECRVELATSVTEDMKSQIVFYGTNIGTHRSALSFDAAARAISPRRYPASEQPIAMETIDRSGADHDEGFWCTEEVSLVEKFRERLLPRLARGETPHLSIFAQAPQPLLVRLGTLLTDIPTAEVYQLHREPQGWSWPNDSGPERFIVTEPEIFDGPPVLVLAMSATIGREGVTPLFPEPVSLWHVTIAQPRQDFVRSREHLQAWREQARVLMDRIKTAHGQDDVLHILPAVPISVAIELGRIRQPKADLRWQIYDQNTQLSGFRPALNIGEVT